MFACLAVSRRMCTLLNFHTLHRTNVGPLEYPEPNISVYLLRWSVYTLSAIKITYPTFWYTSRGRYNT